MKKSNIPVPISRTTILLCSVVGIVSVALLALSNGNVGAALAPIFVIVGAVAIVSLPLRYSVLAFYGSALLFTDPASLPMSSEWEGPLEKVGKLIHGRLTEITGVGGLNFSLIQLLTLVFLAIIVFRTFLHNNIDCHQNKPAARSMKIAVFFAGMATIFFILKGKMSGASPVGLLWQSKMFLFSSFIVVIFMRAFKTEETFRHMGIGIVVIAVVRILEGLFFYLFIKPADLELEYIMTHEDSCIFVIAFVVLLLKFIEMPSKRNLQLLLVLGGIVQVGLVLNDRRIAFVSLALCLFLNYFFLDAAIRRRINRVFKYALPVIALYVVIGMHSNAKIFTPVKSVTSVSDQTDPSNLCRDYENVNMIETLRPNPVLGTGFGFPYIEIIVPCDLGIDNFQFIPHNHILMLAYLTGVVGFFLIWFPLALGSYLAFRSRKYAQNRTQRIAALMAICTIISYFIQVFGDMGTIGWTPNIVLCAGLAMVANLAKRTDSC